ncbi:MAG TPA: transposase [Pseudonocardiaceae bacterium]|nr:transposase [Pseudonocardiaceae bacterium]
MYLRETRRSNRDGSVVRYLQLAHNERHPDTGVPTARVIHNFGRVEKVDRAGLARLVSSISRFLDPASAVAAASGAEVEEVVDSRHLGGAWTLDRVWERLGIGRAIRAAADGRRLDAEATERVIFALVAQRALEPGSKLAATGWVAQRVAIEGCPGFDADAAYAAMDFLLDALGEVAAGVFDTTASLLNLSCDVVFVDTTSTYWELDGADELAELACDVDEETSSPAQHARRTYGHSKDHRPELPQVVIGMVVTREGVPIRCWTFPGNTADTAIIRRIKDDLTDWRLHRLVWVADRGFASAANRAYLTHGGGHYIHAEKLRQANTEAAAALARAGRYRSVAGNLRVKEVRGQPRRRERRRGARRAVRRLPQPGGRRAGRRGARAAHRPPR